MARIAEIIQASGETQFLDLDKISHATLDAGTQVLEVVWPGKFLRITHATDPNLYAAMLNELRTRLDYVKLPPTASPVS